MYRKQALKYSHQLCSLPLQIHKMPFRPLPNLGLDRQTEPKTHLPMHFYINYAYYWAMNVSA